jgi:deazaflavin-dependent oxidoreductase (nitroreductase family)
MKLPFIKTFMSAHIGLYRKTHGRLGHKALKHRFLLLSTVGHKSGLAHTTPLSYFKENGRYILVASNWGRPNHPHWFQNLLKKPRTSIEVGGELIQVKMTQAANGDYDKLWQHVSQGNNHYIKYQEGISRQIPLVVLTPDTLKSDRTD